MAKGDFSNDPATLDFLDYVDSYYRLQVLYSENARRAGLDEAHLHLCWLLQLNDNLTQKDLAARMHLPKQTVNNLIRSLVEKDYIELVPAPSDHRAKVICLTPTGRTYVETINSTVGSIEKRAFMGLSPEDRQLYLRVQEEFYRGVCEEMGITPIELKK